MNDAIRKVLTRHSLPEGPLTKPVTVRRRPKGTKLHLPRGCSEEAATVLETITWLHGGDICPACAKNYYASSSFFDWEMRSYVNALTQLDSFEEEFKRARHERGWARDAAYGRLIEDIEQALDPNDTSHRIEALPVDLATPLEQVTTALLETVRTARMKLQDSLHGETEKVLVEAVILHNPLRWLQHDTGRSANEIALVHSRALARQATWSYLNRGLEGLRGALSATLSSLDEDRVRLLAERGTRTDNPGNPVSWLRAEMALYVDEVTATWSTLIDAACRELRDLGQQPAQVYLVEPLPEAPNDGATAAALNRSRRYPSTNRRGSGLVVCDPLSALVLGRELTATALRSADSITETCLPVAMELWDPRDPTSPLADVNQALVTADALQ
jgi:hypothetical protein